MYIELYISVEIYIEWKYILFPIKIYIEQIEFR